ncbi:unnamed protein product [Urochloa humidicola]
MKLPLIRPLWPGLAPAATSPDAAPEPAKPSLPAAWLLLHALFCATSMAVGFRFSRLIVYLLFLPTPPINPAAHLVSLVSPPVMLAGGNATATITTTTTTTTTVTTTTTTVAAEIGAAAAHHHHHHGPVFVGRHPIRVRPWPHPDPTELLKAHRILAAVQNAQRTTKRRAAAAPPRPVIAVTPTTTSALQVPYLTSLAHTLRLVDAPQLLWIVVEPAHRTDAVAAVLSRSNLDFLHITGPGDSTAALRMHALREIRAKRMDGIVVFADENSILRTELFDEAQKVGTVGAVPVGILGEDDGASESFLQAPSCDAAGNLVGYRVSEETVLPANRGDMLLSSRLEWAGFVVSARALWEDAKERPAWVRDLAAIDDADTRAASPLALVIDTARVEPLAGCAPAALAWSLRSDSLHEVQFPQEWKIDPPVLNTGSHQQTAKPETPLQQTTLANTEDQH